MRKLTRQAGRLFRQKPLEIVTGRAALPWSPQGPEKRQAHEGPFLSHGGASHPPVSSRIAYSRINDLPTEAVHGLNAAGKTQHDDAVPCRGHRAVILGALVVGSLTR